MERAFVASTIFVFGFMALFLTSGVYAENVILSGQAHAQSLPSYCAVEDGETVCTIDILPFAEPQSYNPLVAEVPLGAKIIFENTGPEIHTATSTDATKDEAAPTPNEVFDTGILAPDEKSESIVMDEKGTFRYYCAVHPDMRATLVVGKVGETSPAPTSPTMSQSSLVPTQFSSTTSSGNSMTGGELPITKISSVGDEAYIVDGVTPKGGSDAFSYDGSGHKEIIGHVQVELNPRDNTGKITADWIDPQGHSWKLEQTKFGGGNELYPGEVVDGELQYELDADPVAINHYEHGTTGAGPPVEPTLFVYLASWGPAEVWKDGVSQGTFETHMMITDAARNPDTGKIIKSDGTTPYSPMTPGDSQVNKHAAQLHLVYHTPAGDPTDNFPPPFEVFEHLMFYNLDPPLPVTHVIGANAYVVDGTTPKGGSDAFSYDGSGHKKLQTGQVEVDLDPKSNSGSILAEWTDSNGDDWKLEQTQFGGGNELYPDELVDNKLQYALDADPVAINHYEHGTTGAGPPVEPTLFVYLASWGPAEVFKNGQSQGTFETHMMITDAARNPDTGKIIKSDGTTPYSPMTPGDSQVNKHAAQLHLVYHTPTGEPTNNFPPPYEEFVHLMFYDLDVLPNVSAQSPAAAQADESPTPQTPDGGGCLIATAAFGSEMAPQVQFLREIRDSSVMSTQSGTSFMTAFNTFYYSFSPTVADWERQNPVFQQAVKTTITPLLSSLTLLQYTDIDTEEEMLGYGIGIIMLNIGMYFVAPALVAFKIKSKFRSSN